MRQTAINIIWCIVGALSFVFLLHTRVTLKPFSIHFENWRFVLGIILIFVGVEIIIYGEMLKYKKKVIETIKQELHEGTSYDRQGEQRHGKEE